MTARAKFIGEAAQKAGVTVKAIRYYERIGLIPKSGRSLGKYRLFPEDTVHRIQFIKRAQGLGFTLGEIADILVVYDQGQCSCGQVMKSVAHKLGVIDAKVRELESLKTDLLVVKNRLEKQQGQRSTTICPVIHESTQLPQT